MNIIEIQSVTKQFDTFYANRDLSLTLEQGTIFGLLGPNGSGKTTLIRMINRITRPDSGQIMFQGHPIKDDDIFAIGYLPEERGMYKSMSLREQMIFFGRLKGVPRDVLDKRIIEYFEKFGLMDWLDKKIDQLSKGMQQKAQFIAAIIHQPQLVILDEPFTGLDPVNTNLIKTEIKRMKEAGVTIIFSTHRMEQVEEICEEIALINHGHNILQGVVSDIKNTYKDNRFLIQLSDLPDANLLTSLKIQDYTLNPTNKTLEFTSTDTGEANNILKQLINSSLTIYKFEEILPSLNQIFIKLVS